jgi:branched-chain amino acid transport system permease protein
MNIGNFANGDFLMLSTYFVHWLWVLFNLDLLIPLVITFGFFFCFGYIIERIIIKPLNEHPSHDQMLVTLGLTLIIQNLVIMVWKADRSHTICK